MAESPARNANSWTITGASAETREKVKAAADAAGISIRAWVDQTLNAAADGELIPRKGPAPVAVDPKTLADIGKKLDDLLARMPANTKAAEKEAAQATTAAVLKALASGFQETSRSAKQQASAVKPKKKKKRGPAKQAATSTSPQT